MVSEKSYPVSKILQDTAFARGVLARVFPALRLPAMTIPAAQSNGSIDCSDPSGRGRTVNSDDGNTYCKGHQGLIAAGQTVSSTSAALVTGLQTNVSASSYYIDGVISWTQGATAAAQNFWFNGPSVSFIRVPYFFALNGSGVSNGVGSATHIGSGGGASMVSPAFAIGTSCYLYFKGMVEFSGTGAFGVSVSEGTSGDPFTILADSALMIFPI